MRILLWHGYLLGGTGSNVYSRALAREWSRGGHEVVVASQERAPEQYDLGGAQTRPTLAPSTFAKCSQTWLATLSACSTFLPAWTSTGSFCRTVAQRSRTCSQRPARIHRTAATSACPTTATRSAWPRFSKGSGRSSFTSGS